MKTPANDFPKKFVWGVATAAPQIEGAAKKDGKGPSIWDVYSRLPGKTHGGDTPSVACDHYRLFRQDVRLMARLGVKHYRLSIAWPRVFPDGEGRVNPRGLRFYNHLIDALLAQGITPWVTMFHWDLPQKLEERYGGWRSRRTVDAFAGYADLMVRALGDRVKNWITLNETICFTRYGYGGGNKAPGLSESEQVVNQTFHHALLCHGHGVRAVRELGGKGAKVGLTDNCAVPIPVTETPRDIQAARKFFLEENIRVLDPIFRGRYGGLYHRLVGPDAAKIEPGDEALISLPTDFLGMNIYSGLFVRAGKDGKPERLPFPRDHPKAASPWLKLAPQALYWGPRLAAETYGIKNIYITECGAGYDHEVVERGEVNDLHRREIVRSDLNELLRGIRDGVPTRGFFLWSLMDNFEWQDGYARRFGIVHCNFKTQRRTPKLSALWYREVMKANRVV
jgi:beta-glucosidase